jgi:hypothetical protein
MKAKILSLVRLNLMKKASNTQANRIIFTDESNGSIISPLVTAEMRNKLLRQYCRHERNGTRRGSMESYIL